MGDDKITDEEQLSNVVKTKTSDSIVIIPTYNEKENAEKIIRAVFALGVSISLL